MIAALRGTVLSVRDDILVLDVHGVGYELQVTGSVLGQAPFRDELALIVHTDVKENAISLFGFQVALEREVFLLLKKVKGIGSKIAMGIVSTLGAEGVLTAVGHNDLSSLKRVSGVGGKTAERILVELREQVGELLGAAPEGARTAPRGTVVRFPTRPEERRGVEEDVVLALEKLGFPVDRARQVVAVTLSQGEETDPPDAGELLRRALGNLR